MNAMKPSKQPSKKSKGNRLETKSKEQDMREANGGFSDVTNAPLRVAEAQAPVTQAEEAVMVEVVDFDVKDAGVEVESELLSEEVKLEEPKSEDPVLEEPKPKAKKSKEPKPFAPWDLKSQGQQLELESTQYEKLVILERALFLRRQCKTAFAPRDVFTSKLGKEEVNVNLDEQVEIMLRGAWMPANESVQSEWVSDDVIHLAFVARFVS